MKANTWDFVEEYYPNYGSCDIILENDMLSVICEDEIVAGSLAEKMYNDIKSEHTGGLLTDECVLVEANRRLIESNCYIYEEAIKNFLKQTNK